MEYLLSMLFGAIVSAACLYIGYRLGRNSYSVPEAIERKERRKEASREESGAVKMITPDEIREETKKPFKNKMKDLLGL